MTRQSKSGITMHLLLAAITTTTVALGNEGELFGRDGDGGVPALLVSTACIHLSVTLRSPGLSLGNDANGTSATRRAFPFERVLCCQGGSPPKHPLGEDL